MLKRGDFREPNEDGDGHLSTVDDGKDDDDDINDGQGERDDDVSVAALVGKIDGEG